MQLSAWLPAIATTRGGYDGKGQFLIRHDMNVECG
jgi:phosphoribosylaminoimidazole carboxylase (NCAIR synthetase)